MFSLENEWDDDSPETDTVNVRPLCMLESIDQVEEMLNTKFGKVDKRGLELVVDSLPLFPNEAQHALLVELQALPLLEGRRADIRRRLEVIASLVKIQRHSLMLIVELEREHQERAAEWFQNEVGMSAHDVGSLTLLHGLLLDAQNPDMACEAYADALGEGDEHAIPFLRHLSQHQNPDVRGSVHAALSRIRRAIVE